MINHHNFKSGKQQWNFDCLDALISFANLIVTVGITNLGVVTRSESLWLDSLTRVAAGNYFFNY